MKFFSSKITHNQDEKFNVKAKRFRQPEDNISLHQLKIY